MTCSAPQSFGLTPCRLNKLLLIRQLELPRDAAAQSHRDLITKGVTVKPMMYEEILTTSQHKQLIGKVCTCFEYEELHLTVCHQWLALKPEAQQWISACHITQHWDLTMRMRCKQDLKQ